MTSNRSRVLLVLLVLGLLFARPLVGSVLYTVDEREVAVILQFGEAIASRTEPGLYFKLPLVQAVQRLPKTLNFWHGTRENERLQDVPTADGKKIEVTAWAAWRITDPERFVETLRTLDNAESRVTEFVRSATRDTITSHSLDEIVRSSPRVLTHSFVVDTLRTQDADRAADDRAAEENAGADFGRDAPPVAIKLGREKIVEQIRREAQANLADAGDGSSAGRGIELVDVGIARIEFVPSVRDDAFDKQIAAMEAIASKAISEGERRKQEILNRTDADIQKIKSEGTQQANILRGQVDAEVIGLYATAIEETGEFYQFVRQLEAYQKILDADTRLILTTDSGLFRMLKDLEPLPTDVGGGSTAQ